MKAIFYIGIIGLLVFEFLKVYFIMPMPGSQKIDALDFAYFLHTWRWAFRIGFGLFAILGFYAAYSARKWMALATVGLVLTACLLINYKMAADEMFYQPSVILQADSLQNKIPLNKLVLGVRIQDEARAYPIQVIAYHHQVLDTVAGKAIMVTYCSVCRSGRVFEPMVNGSPESFRLVGMDQYNAMFEDHKTGSWWRQVNGEAIVGPLKGKQLSEVPSEQVTLKNWLTRYPNSLVLQYDSLYLEEYNELDDYDFGVERGDLTRTDTLSWREKSWVIGIEAQGRAKAIDWNLLKSERAVNTELGPIPIVVLLAPDDQSFFAFERPDSALFTVRNDTLLSEEHVYTIWGESLTDSVPPLKKIPAYQEFWHSWRTFHPGSERLPPSDNAL